MRLRELRLELGLSQKELGKLVGVTGGTVSKWEQGKNLPKLRTLINLSFIFKQNLDGLFSAEDIQNILRKTDKKNRRN